MTYDGRERRAGSLTEDRVALMIQEAVSEALRAHEQHLTLHIDKQFALLKQTFSDAFPAGDPHGHRISHEKAIASASEWDTVKRGVIEKIASGGVWAALLFGALAVWDAIKREVGR
jgi:hypothetical protein